MRLLRMFQAVVALTIAVSVSANPSTEPQEESGPAGKAYILSEISPSDAEAYTAYLQQVLPILSRFGGRVVITPFQPKQVIEGRSLEGRIAVIEFPSAEARDAFWASDEYAAVKHLRLENATSRIIHIDP